MYKYVYILGIYIIYAYLILITYRNIMCIIMYKYSYTYVLFCVYVNMYIYYISYLLKY